MLVFRNQLGLVTPGIDFSAITKTPEYTILRKIPCGLKNFLGSRLEFGWLQGFCNILGLLRFKSHFASFHERRDDTGIDRGAM